MSPDKLSAYRKKRDFEETAEPSGSGVAPPRDAPRFVVQEHHARRLHWDLRLEHDGVAVSFAVPNGIPQTPKENRLAVHTEDHPLEYLEWEGEIPRGQYGAGTMFVWDRGTYELHKWEERKIELTFHGERLHGRYGLFPIGRGAEQINDWMIHRMDPPEDPGRRPMPERLEPMLARPGEIPPDESRWSFEVKWDGVRAIAYSQPGRFRLESRNLNEITAAYPEIRGLMEQLGMREAVLDGEIVAFDEHGKPSFERLQSRMHVTGASQIKRLQASTPVLYAIFDLLYFEGESLMALTYSERRARLERLELGGPAWRVPAHHLGSGRSLLEATAAQGLEGVVAKRLDSRYEPGSRNGAWLKIKHTRRQELVIGGWLPGEGRRRERIGALLMGYFAAGDLRYAGRVGTGFSERTLDDLGRRLAPLQIGGNPFTPRPKLPGNAVFVEPALVAEIEFREWTREGIMRAPSFKGLREDKPAVEVVREDKPAVEVVREDPPGAPPSGLRPARHPASPDRAAPESSGCPPAGGGADDPPFDRFEPGQGGAVSVEVDGRELSFSNWDKVLFGATGFTKGDLITFYARVAGAVLPHLHDRALTLKRYPNGVDQPYFYEKQSPSHRPDWVQTCVIKDVNYTLCQDRATLVWLANLADIELHTSLSLAQAPERPTMLVFDLDPGAPAGLVQCCQVGLVLRGMFGALGLETCVKTSGSKGLQVYLPLNGEVSYAQTKPFARRVAELLEQRMPELVVSRMTKTLRQGRVLVDWSQNDEHKTTACVYSVRALERPGVSTPVSWEEVEACRDAGDARQLVFSPDDVLNRVATEGELFAPVLHVVQDLPRI